MHLEYVMEIPKLPEVRAEARTRPLRAVAPYPARALHLTPPPEEAARRDEARKASSARRVDPAERRPTRPSLEAIVAVGAQRTMRPMAAAAALILAILAFLLVMMPRTAGAECNPLIRHDLDNDAVREVVGAHSGQVQACYERALERNPELHGRMVVDFSVECDGAVRSASVQRTTVGDLEMESCVVAAVTSWRFPESREGAVRVVYPFVFDPPRPKPSIALAASVGTSAFRSRLRKNEGVRACYERALARDREVSGELLLRFEIDSRGRVTTVAVVRSALGDEALERCVVDEVKGVTFPSFAGKGSTTLDVPMRFVAEGSAN